MKIIVFFSLVTVTLAQIERNWDTIFPLNVPNPSPINLPNHIPSSRITGGQEAGRNSYPHQAALFLPVEDGTAFCGGSLITSRTILTAAHCVDSLIGPIDVVLGAHNIRIQEATQVYFQNSYVVIHPQWSHSTLLNDIALVILPQAVEFNDVIQPISLPRDDSNTYEGRDATVSGWGRESDSAETISDVLRYVEIPVISNEYCSGLYPGRITDTNVCASGSDGKSACNGDSGGALVVGNEQIGIVSFGNAYGCEIGWPSVFTRVSKYLDFINNHVV